MLYISSPWAHTRFCNEAKQSLTLLLIIKPPESNVTIRIIRYSKVTSPGQLLSVLISSLNISLCDNRRRLRLKAHCLFMPGKSHSVGIMGVMMSFLKGFVSLGRSASPHHGFTIMNRLSTENLVEPINKDLEFQLQDPFLLYRNGNCKLMCGM